MFSCWGQGWSCVIPLLECCFPIRPRHFTPSPLWARFFFWCPCYSLNWSMGWGCEGVRGERTWGKVSWRVLTRNPLDGSCEKCGGPHQSFSVSRSVWGLTVCDVGQRKGGGERGLRNGWVSRSAKRERERVGSMSKVWRVWAECAN